LKSGAERAAGEIAEHGGAAGHGEIAGKAERKRADGTEQLVDKFQSTASPVQGAVDYGEIRWDSFSKAAETTEQFTFYSGRSVAKVIEKSKFSSRQELLTFRRMIRRQVADNELLHD